MPNIQQTFNLRDLVPEDTKDKDKLPDGAPVPPDTASTPEYITELNQTLELYSEERRANYFRNNPSKEVSFDGLSIYTDLCRPSFVHWDLEFVKSLEQARNEGAGVILVIDLTEEDNIFASEDSGYPDNGFHYAMVCVDPTAGFDLKQLSRPQLDTLARFISNGMPLPIFAQLLGFVEPDCDVEDLVEIEAKTVEGEEKDVPSKLTVTFFEMAEFLRDKFEGRVRIMTRAIFKIILTRLHQVVTI